MKDSSTKPAASYLKPGSNELLTVLSKVQAIDRLNKIFKPLLEAKFRPYCHVANLTKGVMVVLTANGAVAAQMRYQTRDLIKALHNNPALSHIKEIQFKVSPHQEPILDRPVDKTRQRNPARPLSEESAKILLDMASTIEDPALREAMERIAKHGK